MPHNHSVSILCLPGDLCCTLCTLSQPISCLPLCCQLSNNIVIAKVWKYTKTWRIGAFHAMFHLIHLNPHPTLAVGARTYFSWIALTSYQLSSSVTQTLRAVHVLWSVFSHHSINFCNEQNKVRQFQEDILVQNVKNVTYTFSNALNEYRDEAKQPLNNAGKWESSNYPMLHEKQHSLISFYFLLLKRELFESLHIMVLDLKGPFLVIMSLNHTNKVLWCIMWVLLL